MRIARHAAFVAALAVAVPATLLAQAEKPLDDPTIVAIFDAANTFDMETGALAASKGTSKDVRMFGRMISRDHEMVRQQGRDLAKKLGVTPTAPATCGLCVAHTAAMKKLKAAKKGAEFDKAFLEHEAAYHRAVIDAVTGTLLPAIRNAELKELVVKVAPAFEAHRAKAADLAAKVVAN